ncbi:MAG: ELM1/GtrOC1 family putative glycosyltransferase [Opitutaceae bacterium]|jgi:hypothetical protein
MKLTSIRVLSDGRPGHENQSIGLAEALRRRTGATVELLRIAPTNRIWRRLAFAQAVQKGGRVPDLIIATGHRMHLPLWVAAAKFKCRSVVIMSPSLPRWLFDLCLIPQHDLRDTHDRGRMVVTRGALNRLPEETAEKTETGVIMIGGPSGHHGWDPAPLLAGIKEIVASRPELKWTVGDSRRTPEMFAMALKQLEPSITFMPHQQTQPGWLPGQLSKAREVWVTEDSMSMVFEALTAGAQVGVLPLPARDARGRPVKAVRKLIADGLVRSLDRWRAQNHELAPAVALHETGRCADLILKRFFS